MFLHPNYMIPATSILVVVALFAAPTLQQSNPIPRFLDVRCGAGDYTEGSPYQLNLNTLLSDLNSNSSSSSFYQTSVAEGSDNTVYGRYFCRYDLSLPVCSTCVQAATMQIVSGSSCPNLKEAIVWFEQCTLLFLNSSTRLDAIDLASPFMVWYTPYNVSDLGAFYPVLQDTMNRVIKEAAYGTALDGFGTVEGNMLNDNTLYSMAQCSPDRLGLLCERCLDKALLEVGMYYNDTVHVAFFYPNCQMRYSVLGPFYDVTNPPPTAPSPPMVVSDGPPVTQVSKDPGQPAAPPAPAPGKNATYYVTRVAVPMALALLLVAGIGFWQRTKLLKLKVINQQEAGMSEEHKSQGPENFSFQSMKKASGNFSDANRLGQGGFGAVYKGKLQNGEEVAIKRLSKESTQGNKEFSTEVLIVAKLQHRNLVRLLGYCEEKKERLLVYEYVPNLSLDQLLFDPSKSKNLDWKTRYNIILGIARGLRYLHHESRLNIVHRDLKTSNILLDADMNPKIADFGLAKLISLDHTQGDTTKVAGTLGYMAPEYIFQGKFSTKSDVYSFGVLLLEIVSGLKICKPNQSENNEGLLQRVWRHWEEGNFEELLDPTIRNEATEVTKCIQIALLCVQHDASTRPAMQMVLSWLNNNSVNIPSPVRPAALAFDTSSTTSIWNSSTSNVIGFMTESSSITSKYD